MVANRDEFHGRAARGAQFWPEHPQVLAGLDLEAGGTWMGVTREGRFAAITNVRRLPAPHKGSVSRGKLVADFLSGNDACEAYLNPIHAQGTLYDGFNLLVGNTQECWYLSNHNGHGPQKLIPGLYGLSNDQLNTPWPKVKFSKDALTQWLAGNVHESQEPINKAPAPLYTLLNNPQSYPTEQLPDTGIGEQWEELLSPAFIISPSYGTRASTGLQIRQNSIVYEEATFNASGQQTNLLTFEF